ncbi:MAG: hypothetical protein R3Y54_08245 [Eubacteriales bacterium]
MQRLEQGVKRSEIIFINILNLIAEQKSKEDILKLYPQMEHIIDRLMKINFGENHLG